MLSCAMAADIGVGVLEVGGTWRGTDLTSDVLLCRDSASSSIIPGRFLLFWNTVEVAMYLRP